MIYILKLENNKYYVGKTTNLKKRINDHKTGNGCSWTTKHRYKELLDTINNHDNFDEDKYTKIYMRKYGINNVRGGSYSNMILSREQILILKLEIRTSENRCFRCNRIGHYKSNCYSIFDSDGNFIEYESTKKKSLLMYLILYIYGIILSILNYIKLKFL